ncbi:MAG: BPSS1780 family membrane protein [Psychrobacter sp.]|uniref:BPSS1780 family membrane protein n=1 Tax=Psychrobacter sp. TaxID=56811 RepID=UPI003F96EC8C
MSNFNHSQQSQVFLQKNGSQPPNLPPMDEYGNLLPQLLSGPRKCETGAGLSWLLKAFELFRDQPLLWLAIGVVYLIIFAIGSSIPFINFIFPFLSFVFIGGIIKGCADQSAGKELRFDHLFSAFNTHIKPLIILSILYAVVLIVAMIPIALIFGGMAMFAVYQSDSFALISVVVGISLAFILVTPILMIIWFAPALIVLHDVEPMQAMKMSFRGCVKNLLPFLVFGLMAPILMLLGTLFTLGLGLIVLLPIGMITYYTSYRDVWTDQPLSAM